jgi:hypothetical protein
MSLAIVGEPTPLGGYLAQHLAEVVGRRWQRIRQPLAFICPDSHFLGRHLRVLAEIGVGVEDDRIASIHVLTKSW